MTLAQNVAKVSANLETATRLGEFTEYIRHWSGANGVPTEAAVQARAAGQLRVAEMLHKATTGALTTSGNALSEYPSMIAAFLTALRSAAAFDAMLPEMRRTPARTRVVAATSGATGYIVNEGQIKPLGALSLTGFTLAEYKAVAVVVQTVELTRALGTDAATFFKNELVAAVAAVVDQKFIQLITTGLTPIASVGVDVTSIWQDLANSFAALDISASSKIFILTDPGTAAVLATKVSSTGAAAFPGFGYNGGTLAGAQVLVTDGLTAGTMVVVDATAIAASAGTVEARVLKHGDVQMSTTPNSPPATTSVLMNLWQQNMTAVAVERSFGAQLMRPTGAVLVTGVNYRTGNSPS